MLLHYLGEIGHKQSNIHFESSGGILMKEDGKMVEKRRFERVFNMMERNSYLKSEEILEIKKIFVYVVKHPKSEKNRYFQVNRI